MLAQALLHDAELFGEEPLDHREHVTPKAARVDDRRAHLPLVPVEEDSEVERRPLVHCLDRLKVVLVTQQSLHQYQVVLLRGV